MLAMHVEVEDYLRRSQDLVPWAGAYVVEVGAADWNGSARDHVSGWLSWEGIDLEDGPGVDYVGDAVGILRTLQADGRSWDVAVSTEVLEHARDWRGIVRAMVSCLEPGGYVVITCAGPGRPAHSATGAAQLAHGEYYRNVSLEDLSGLLVELGCTMVDGESGPPGDTRVVART